MKDTFLFGIFGSRSVDLSTSRRWAAYLKKGAKLYTSPLLSSFQDVHIDRLILEFDHLVIRMQKKTIPQLQHYTEKCM